MIKIENIEVFNFEGAIRAMRNPLESWSKSDSGYTGDEFILGIDDIKLANKLVKAGTDHSKFMRQIFISMDIYAPVYWWKEMDTYKVGTVANSGSTMHTLCNKLLTYLDFSWDKMTPYRDNTIYHLNKMITTWQQGGKKDKQLWREIIQDLPSSYNQLRTWTANYQVLRNIYFARRSHKLSEWREFCEMIESLPYSELIIGE
jgi:hypothetical protein